MFRNTVFFLILSWSCLAVEPSSPNERAADRALENVEGDLVKLATDAVAYVVLRSPSFGSMGTDAVVDASLRQSPVVANAIKALEKGNPTTGAVFRDGIKLVTILVKMAAKFPVDQSGRLFDRWDFLTQSSKFGLKVVGFSGIASLGYLDSKSAKFLVNTLGDVGSQIFQEVGEAIRTAPAQATYLNGFLSSLNSVPVKAAVGSIVGSGIEWSGLDYLVGNFTQGMLEGEPLATIGVVYLLPCAIELAQASGISAWTIPIILIVFPAVSSVESVYFVGNKTIAALDGADQRVKDAVFMAGNKTVLALDRGTEIAASTGGFIKGFLVDYARSISKSLLLTTGCKVAMDITRKLSKDPKIGWYVKPAIGMFTAFSLFAF